MNEGDVRRILIEDRQAGFVALVRWSSGDLYRGLVRLVGDRTTAEDLSQDTYLRAWNALESYSDGRIRDMKIRGWLWTIAMNRGRSHLKKRFDPVVEPPPPVDIGGAVADADECARLLDMLSGPARAAVVMRHVVGLSYGEISEILGKPIGTVKSDVHRGLQTMRQKGDEQ